MRAELRKNNSEKGVFFGHVRNHQVSLFIFGFRGSTGPVGFFSYKNYNDCLRSRSRILNPAVFHRSESREKKSRITWTLR